MGKILTIEQAAEMLHLNPQVVRKYLREGKLPGMKIGRHWRVSEEGLSEFVRQGGSSLAAWNERARQWRTLPPDEKERRLSAIVGKYAHIPFSSEDLMQQHREEIEREGRVLRKRSDT